MTVWSPVPRSQGLGFPTHAERGGPLGRPDGPACGVTNDGLFLRADVSWSEVPAGLRCRRCAGVLAPPPWANLSG